MDRFDQLVPTLAAKAKEMEGKCLCPGCPTYTECAKGAGELMYCLNGQSFHCITEDLGCVCPACPLTEELGLLNLTFCLLGSETSQRMEQKTGVGAMPLK